MTPDVARSMAAHPSSQRPKIVHLVCGEANARLCGGAPIAKRPTEGANRQRCVVCDDLTHSMCQHCKRIHRWGAK